MSACAHAPPNVDAPNSLAEAERAFARDASVRTVNEAFLNVFADSMTLFRPTPTNGNTALAQRPIPATLDLRWGPIYAETSADGSLGFTTGPSTNGQRGQPPAGTGFFLSVWQKQNGVWKLRTDGGIDSPIPLPLESALRSLTTHVGGRSFKDGSSVMEAERTLIADYANGFAQYADENARVYRNGTPPTTTRAAAVELAAKDQQVEFSPTSYGVAGSNDLAFVYGVVNPKSDKPRAYERIYRRDAKGQWKIAADWRN